MSGNRMSIIPGGGAGLLAPTTAGEVVTGVVDLIRTLSAEHTRRKTVEAQCRVLVVQLEAQARENRIALKNQFKQRGMTLERLLGFLDRVVERDQLDSPAFDKLLDLVLRILEYDALGAARRSGMRALPSGSDFVRLGNPEEPDE